MKDEKNKRTNLLIIRKEICNRDAKKEANSLYNLLFFFINDYK